VIISNAPSAATWKCVRSLATLPTPLVRNADTHHCTEYKRKEGMTYGRNHLQQVYLLGSRRMPYITGTAQ